MKILIYLLFIKVEEYITSPRCWQYGPSAEASVQGRPWEDVQPQNCSEPVKYKRVLQVTSHNA